MDSAHLLPHVRDIESALQGLAKDRAPHERKIAEHQAALDTIDDRMAKYRQILDGYYDLHPDLRDRSDATSAEDERAGGKDGRRRRSGSSSSLPFSPKGSVRTRPMMKDVLRAGSGPMSPRTVFDDLLELGWNTRSKNPINVVRTELAAMAKTDPEIERLEIEGNAFYRIRRKQAAA